MRRSRRKWRWRRCGRMRQLRSWPSGMACIRTSTIDQIDGIEYQERDLKAVGIEKLFRELTSAIGTRPQFEGAMAFMREGDVLIVTKLDRLARSVPDLCSIVTKLETKGIALRILAMNSTRAHLQANSFSMCSELSVNSSGR